MKKFLFSCFTILLMSGFVGSLDALASGFNCSGGDPFYGTSQEIDSWISQLQQGICSGSPGGTKWVFVDVHDMGEIEFYYYPVIE